MYPCADASALPGIDRQGGEHEARSARRRAPRLILAAVLIVLALSAGVRFLRLGTPSEYMFDEVYYAKDAKAILDGRMDPRKDYPWEPGDVTSWAHPDAGKIAIAVGIVLLGDNSWGWRLTPALAGLALLALTYPIARRLGLSPGWAFVALLLAATDLLGIVQSRIATLDVFVGLWTVLAIYLALRYVQDGRRVVWLLLAGLAVGLACATKWSGLLAVIAALAVILVPWFRTWTGWDTPSPQGRALPDHEVTSDEQATSDERSDLAFDVSTAAPAPPRSRLVSTLRVLGLLAVAFGLIPAAVYLAAYLPYFLDGHTWAQFVQLHREMLHFNLTLSAPHSYASRAQTWIVDKRPVWYYFQGKRHYHAVVAMGNPFLWWLSIGALVLSPIAALTSPLRERRLPLLAALLVVILYVPWFAASRTSFLYYMTPVAPFLALVAAATLAWISRSALADDRVDQGMTAAGIATQVVPAAAAAVITAFAWYPIGRLAGLDSLTARSPLALPTALAFTRSGAAIVLSLAIVLLLLARQRSRALAAALIIGVVAGICIPFLPIAVDIAISPEQFYRLMWFPSWI